MDYDAFEKRVIELFSEVYDEPIDEVVGFVDNLKDNDDDYIQSLYQQSVVSYDNKEHNYEDEYIIGTPVRLLELIY